MSVNANKNNAKYMNLLRKAGGGRRKRNGRTAKIEKNKCKQTLTD